MAAVGIFEHFIEVLIFLGIGIAPVAGVYLVDFHINRTRYGVESSGAPVSLRWKPFLAWGAGTLLAVLTLPRASHGLGLVHLTSIPTIDALLGAALVQWLLDRAPSRTHTGERSRRELETEP
jgi:purine-cytosine permease-like protein